MIAGAKPSLRLASCCIVEVVKGGGGLRRAGFASTLVHLEDCVLEIAGEGFRLGARADVEALDLLPVGADQARFEDFVARGRQLGDDRPIFLGDEFLDFELAVADKTQRDRLHAAGGAGARQLAPEHRREREADEIIERTAGEVGIDQRAIDLARMLHRLGHRLLGDGVEDDALDLLVLERLLFLQHLEHVPGDRFAFAIRVGGEDQLVGTLERAGDIVHALVRPGVDFPEHVEIVVRIDRAILWGEVADMAKRGQNLVAGAEVFIDRLRLGRQLDYDNIHENPVGYPPAVVENQGGIGRMIGPEHGEGDPYCQISGLRTRVRPAKWGTKETAIDCNHSVYSEISLSKS